MNGEAWLELFRSEPALYLWGAYLVGLALVIVENALLALRERTILGHLGLRLSSPPPVIDPHSGALPPAPR